MHPIVRTLRILWYDIQRTGILRHAGGMAYTLLFSIVPALAAVFALASLFEPYLGKNQSWLDQLRNFILANLAPETGHQALQYLETFVANLNVTKIGLTGLGGILITLVFLLHNVENALNQIWRVPSARSVLRRFLFFWTFITLGAFVLSLTVAVLARVGLAGILPFAGPPGAEEPAFAVLYAQATTLAFFTFLYKVGPNCHVTYRAALMGGVVATLLLRVASAGFHLYAAHTSFYENVYGAVAAVPLFLLWLYIAWVVTLLGSLVAWRVQHGLYVFAEGENIAPGMEQASPDFERNLQLRGLMPLLCILAVNYRFTRPAGGGARGLDVAADLDLPLNWVTEGLAVAMSRGFVVMAARRYPEGTQPTAAEAEYFPAVAPGAVKLGELALSLTQESFAWLRSRHPRIPFDQDRLEAFLKHSFRREAGEVDLGRLLRDVHG